MKSKFTAHYPEADLFGSAGVFLTDHLVVRFLRKSKQNLQQVFLNTKMRQNSAIISGSASQPRQSTPCFYIRRYVLRLEKSPSVHDNEPDIPQEL